MSNLKQIGLGMIMYRQDYDEVGCPNMIGTYTSAGDQLITFAVLVQPYTKSTQVFNCPSRSFAPLNTWGLTFPMTYMPNTDIHYRAYAGWATVPDAAIQDSVKTISLMEAVGPDWPDGIGTGFCDLYMPQCGPNNDPYNWGLKTKMAPHLETGNYLFHDGHVKTYRYDQLTRSMFTVAAD